MSIDAISTTSPATLAPTTKVAVDLRGQSASTPASTTASTVAAALKEATETAAETAKEAGHGDRQAQKLLQKQQHPVAQNQAAVKPASVVNGTGQITGEIINTKA
ncbi:hypothetical protein [Pseudomonas sp. NA-150]|uniref:hypothetical protein n=1 Tax=Pseudomonas sp. NA-150 TaxID=3367525 RepID=UPI0037C66D86